MPKKLKVPTYSFPYFQLATPLPATREQQAQHWWINNGRHFRLVACITAESLAQARALLDELAWYRRPEVQLLAQAPLRGCANGDVLLDSSDRWHPWTVQNAGMVDLGSAQADEPLERSFYQKAILALAWSPDGKYYAACGKQGLVWVTTPGSQRDQSYNPHAAYAQALAWSPDGTSIATGDSRDAVHIWQAAVMAGLAGAEADSGRILICREPRLSDWYRGVYAVTWSADSQYVASGNHLGELRVWDTLTGTCVFVNQEQQARSAILAATWSPDGTRLATACEGVVELWNWSAEACAFHSMIMPDVGLVHALAWSPDGKNLLVGGEGHVLALYQGFPYKPALGIKRQDVPLSRYSDVAGVRSVAFAPSGIHAAAGCVDGTVQVTDLTSGEQVCTFFGHKGVVNAVAWSPDGKYLLSGANDSYVLLWDAEKAVREQV